MIFHDELRGKGRGECIYYLACYFLHVGVAWISCFFFLSLLQEIRGGLCAKFTFTPATEQSRRDGIMGGNKIVLFATLCEMLCEMGIRKML